MHNLIIPCVYPNQSSNIKSSNDKFIFEKFIYDL